MGDEVKITGKNLGWLELKKYCPHCLWFLLQFGFHPPYSGFGGAVWKWMETMQRTTVHHLLKRDSCLPDEFDPFCDICSPIEFPNHHSKFGYVHKSGVYVYGVADDIFELKNGNLCLIDYKSAKYKGEDDDFFPQYRVQVVAYSNIAEYGLNLGTVDRGGLMYWEAEVDRFDPAKQYKNGRISPSWKVGTLEIEIDYQILDPLMEEVKKVWNSRVPPEGAAGCKECKKLAQLFAIQNQIDASDQRLLYQYRAYPDVTNYVYDRLFRRNCALREAMSELRSSRLLFSQVGEEPMWDFTNMK
jgi:hypothetical protein